MQQGPQQWPADDACTRSSDMVFVTGACELSKAYCNLKNLKYLLFQYQNNCIKSISITKCFICRDSFKNSMTDGRSGGQAGWVHADKHSMGASSSDYLN